MQNLSRSARPAETAIAAVIALLSTTAFAQTTDPATAPPTAAPPLVAPTVVAPTQGSTIPVFAPANPVVQPVAPTPTPTPTPVADTPPPAVQSTPKTASSAPASAKAAKSAPMPETRPGPVEKSSTAAVPTASLTPPRPAQRSSEVAVPPAAPLQSAPAADNETAEWALGLGALAVLAGIGIVLTRRRNDDETEFRRSVNDPVAARVVSLDDDVEPVAPMKMPRPAVPLPEDDDLGTRRDAMVAAPPSVDNPFLTRRNRMRRANFLLRRQGEVLLPAQTETIEDRRLPSDPVRRAVQVSYSMGGSGSLRPPVLKPGLT